MSTVTTYLEGEVVMTTEEPIYVYPEQSIYRGVTDGEASDAVLYADSEAEAIERAREDLALTDPRPGGAAYAYAHATARAVLRHFGAE